VTKTHINRFTVNLHDADDDLCGVFGLDAIQLSRVSVDLRMRADADGVETYSEMTMRAAERLKGMEFLLFVWRIGMRGL